MRAEIPKGPTDRLSWWCGLSREDFSKHVAQHVPQWRVQRRGWIDHIGAQIVGWREPIVRRRGEDD